MKLGLGLNLKTSGGAWTPARFGSNLKMWLRKDTGMTIDGAGGDGDNITQWRDQSGSGNHMLAGANYYDYDSATGGAESADTTNGKLLLATDGTKDITFTAGFSLYVRLAVSTVTTGGHDLFVYDSDGPSVDFLRLHNTTELRSKINGSTKVGWTYTNPTLDSFNNWGYERDGSNNLTTYLNNSALTKITSGGYDTGAVSGDLVLDAIGGNFDGIIKEVVWVDRGLTASERTALQTYFNKI
tara:strand:- start:335 stop:1057 length:723 start_codon:yes stop_codon:yes gene_type:complete